MINSWKIGIIGLGYVGLPLAIEFGKKFDVVGFDINSSRISELRNGKDRTREANIDDLNKVIAAKNGNHFGLRFSNEPEDLSGRDFFIVTVPTPIDEFKNPDLKPLLSASALIGKILKKGNIVIYESTVYPGCTEEECVPELEKASGLTFNQDFFVGYSPERINPSDKEHTLSKILKITSGSNPEVADKIDELYKSIIVAGTHKAPSIKVAEAAKVIENSQRDINIAFINELAKIFNKIGIDTYDVLAAAGTKWNFIKFKPGLVGGHCIGVDPYYLAQKAQEIGYHPEIILAGRRLNDGMGSYIANEVVKLMVKSDIKIKGAEVLILGITFKENCTDVRNSRVIDIVKELHSFQIKIQITDPWADGEEVFRTYGVVAEKNLPSNKRFDAVILAVAHDEFSEIDFGFLTKSQCIIYDVKGVLDKSIVQGRL